MKKIFVIFLLLFGCAPNSMEEFRWETESTCLSLSQELSQVETVADLQAREKKIKKKLDHLADLLIAVDTYLQKHPDEQILNKTTVGARAFQKQLERIYAIEGGQETFESISQMAFQKLQLTIQSTLE